MWFNLRPLSTGDIKEKFSLRKIEKLQSQHKDILAKLKF